MRNYIINFFIFELAAIVSMKNFMSVSGQLILFTAFFINSAVLFLAAEYIIKYGLPVRINMVQWKIDGLEYKLEQLQSEVNNTSRF